MLDITNRIIRASAGSGKTYALTIRVIRLLLLGVPPSSIVALTFTRNAAGEIFDETITKLATASQSEKDFHEISQAVGNDIVFTQHDCVKLMRGLLASLHSLQFGTLDSFFAKMLRQFSYDAGLPPGWGIIEESEHEIIQSTLMVDTLLARDLDDQSKEEFLEAYRLSTYGNEKAGILGPLMDFIKKAQRVYVNCPDNMSRLADQLNPMLMGGGIANPLEDAERFLCLLEQRSTEVLRQEGTKKKKDKYRVTDKQIEAWKKLIETLRQGSLQSVIAMTVASNMLKAYDPTKRCCDPFNIAGGKPDLESQDWQVAGQVAWGIVSQTISQICANTGGVWRVLARYDQSYWTQAQTSGRLSFADLPRALSVLRKDTLKTADIEFRLDSKLDHWLLDEFQDTSREQWKAIANLCDEAISDAERRKSFFAVGDTKQSIYGWRGGDQRLFQEIVDRYKIQSEPRSQIYRCSPAVLDLVNAVFDEEGSSFESLAEVEKEWRANDAWMTHKSAVKDIVGYAAVLATQPAPMQVLGSELVEQEDEKPQDSVLLALLDKIRPTHNGLSCAVIVHGNTEVSRLSELLREQGIPVAAEGKINYGSDNLVARICAALLCLLAEDDSRFARGWVLAFAGVKPGRAWLEALESHRQRLAAEGVKVFLEKALGELGRDREWSEFDMERKRQVLELAQAHDATGSRDLTVFLHTLRQAYHKAPPTPGVVQVMTVHASKGLGFDVVILPTVDSPHALGSARIGEMLEIRATDSGDPKAWILPPVKNICDAVPLLRDAKEQAIHRNDFEGLCKLYVALTRARFGLFLIMPPYKERKNGEDRSTVRYSEYLLARLFPANAQLQLETAEAGQVLWERGEWSDVFHAKHKKVESHPAPQEKLNFPSPERPRLSVAPSRLHGSKTAPLVVPPDTRLGSTYGTLVHECLALVERATPETLNQAALAQPHARCTPFGDNNPWQAALELAQSSKVSAIFSPSSECEIRVEMPFEIIMDGQWITGIMDRVHLHRNAEGRVVSADIFDFKTDAVSAEQLEDLVATHGEQLATYRKVLAQLTSLPLSGIRATVISVRHHACLVIPSEI